MLRRSPLPLVALVVLAVLTGCATAAPSASPRSTRTPTPTPTATAAGLAGLTCADLVDDDTARRVLDTTAASTFPGVLPQPSMSMDAVGGLGCVWTFGAIGSPSSVQWTLDVAPAAVGEAATVADEVAASPDCVGTTDPAAATPRCTSVGAEHGWWYRSEVTRESDPGALRDLVAPIRTAVGRTLDAITAPTDVPTMPRTDCAALGPAMDVSGALGRAVPAPVEEGDDGLPVLGGIYAAALQRSGITTCDWTSVLTWNVSLTRHSTAAYAACAAFPGAKQVALAGVQSAVELPAREGRSILCASDGTSSFEAQRPTLPDDTTIQPWDAKTLAFAAHVVPGALRVASA